MYPGSKFVLESGRGKGEVFVAQTGPNFVMMSRQSLQFKTKDTTLARRPWLPSNPWISLCCCGCVMDLSSARASFAAGLQGMLVCYLFNRCLSEIYLLQPGKYTCPADADHTDVARCAVGGMQAIRKAGSLQMGQCLRTWMDQIRSRPEKLPSPRRHGEGVVYFVARLTTQAAESATGYR